MALEMTYNLNGDFPITAYVRIRSLQIEYNPTLASTLGATKYICKPILEVKSGKDKNALDSWHSEAWVFGYDHTINTSPIKQAYEKLKLLPEFSTVIDKID